MKKIHIAMIIMVIVAVGLFIKSSGEFSTYGTFSDADSNKKVKVVGEFADNPDIQYNPQENANRYTFMMKDNDGIERRVIVNQPKQQDFERSDQVVVIGKMEDDVFVADEVLVKCPSKYKDEEEFIRTQKKKA